MFEDDFPLIWRFFAPFMLRFSDKILCVSTPIKAQFQQNPKLEVLYNGLDPNEFIIDRDEIRAWREKLGVSVETRLVGVASRISPWKGQDVFLQACALLKEEVQNVHYLLAGDTFKGNEYLIEELQAFVDANNLNKQVTFTGFVDDPRSLIAALDILVLPSIRPDPFPGIVLEGMALGVPLVATNIGGPMEQVEDGRTGFLVPPSDPDAMAAAILNLLNDADLRQSMGKAGQDRVAREFTLNATRSRLEDLYQRLA
jgi:glycosyltransferase involved in cell wall biosynthesis